MSNSSHDDSLSQARSQLGDLPDTLLRQVAERIPLDAKGKPQDPQRASEMLAILHRELEALGDTLGVNHLVSSTLASGPKPSALVYGGVAQESKIPDFRHV